MTEHSASVASAPSVPAAAFVLQRKCSCGRHTSGGETCTECGKKKHPLQRKAEPGRSFDSPVPDSVLDVLRSTGTPLDPAARRYMEPKFGHDFSGVRVHTDSSAANSARAVGAFAYTVGQHIVFAEGQHAPHSAAGQHLLAHELTHSIQQRTSPISLSPRLVVGAVDTAAEVEADRVADRVVGGDVAPAVRVTPAPALQRAPGPTLVDKPDSADNADAKAEPDFNSPQQRGGQGRAATVDAGKRGDDQVKIRVVRYLCACVGHDEKRPKASVRMKPNPGARLELCDGDITVGVFADIVPQTATKGTAKVGADVNVAHSVNVDVDVQAQNTGKEPQVGPGAGARLRLPGRGQAGVDIDVLK
jgi:hypothetical protein